MQNGWRRWKRALKESNQLDDEGFEDEAARAAAKMVADAHKNFGKPKGKKAAAADEEDAEPFSLLHKVLCWFSTGSLSGHFDSSTIQPWATAQSAADHLV